MLKLGSLMNNMRSGKPRELNRKLNFIGNLIKFGQMRHVD